MPIHVLMCIYKEQLDKEKYIPDRIRNIDETTITAVHEPAKILAKCLAEQVGRKTSGEKAVTTTAICAVSASGVYIPPMLIYKRKRMNDLLLKGSSPGTIIIILLLITHILVDINHA